MFHIHVSTILYGLQHVDTNTFPPKNPREFHVTASPRARSRDAFSDIPWKRVAANKKKQFVWTDDEAQLLLFAVYTASKVSVFGMRFHFFGVNGRLKRRESIRILLKTYTCKHRGHVENWLPYFLDPRSNYDRSRPVAIWLLGPSMTGREQCLCQKRTTLLGFRWYYVC